MAQLDVRPTCDQEVVGSNLTRSATSFVEIDHEILSMFILSLLLIQGGQVSVSGKRMHNTNELVNRLEDLAHPVKVWLGKLTVLDMTLLD